MNRLHYLFIPLFVVSCIGKHKSDAPEVTVNPTVEQSVKLEADKLIMNLEKSRIDWIATEMRGAKRRTGNISFKEGMFLSQNGEIVGGKFIVDMETMDISDVPIHEKIAVSIKKVEVSIAKNYLNEDEIKLLDLLVEQYLAFAETMAQQQTPIYMKDWIERLANILQLNGRELLTRAGKISHKKALEKSGKEYVRQ